MKIRYFTIAAVLIVTAGCSTQTAGRGMAAAVSTAPAASAEVRTFTATQVADAFKEAGLDVRELRDNTDGWCPTIGCDQFLTSEDVTVVSFPTERSGNTYAVTLGASGHQIGNVVLSYLAQHTPDDAQAKYESALRELLAD